MNVKFNESNIIRLNVDFEGTRKEFEEMRASLRSSESSPGLQELYDKICAMTGAR